jgi:protein phosphatase
VSGVHVRVAIARPTVVALVGPSGSGKSTFARRHFAPEEIFSSDAWRERLSGDASNQRVSRQAFRALYAVARERLDTGGVAVIDATNLDVADRGHVLDLAAQAGCPVIAIVLALPLGVCLERNAARPGRRVPEAVVRRQHRRLGTALSSIDREGFDAVHVIDGPDALESVIVERIAPRPPRAGD